MSDEELDAAVVASVRKYIIQEGLRALAEKLGVSLKKLGSLSVDEVKERLAYARRVDR